MQADRSADSKKKSSPRNRKKVETFDLPSQGFEISKLPDHEFQKRFTL